MRYCVYDANFVTPSKGPIISFNIYRSNETVVGYSDVQRLAKLHSLSLFLSLPHAHINIYSHLHVYSESGIHLRTGCFCNPGACAEALSLSGEEMKSNFFSGHICWDDNDVINGKPTGGLSLSSSIDSLTSSLLSSLTLIHTHTHTHTHTPPLSLSFTHSLSLALAFSLALLLSHTLTHLHISTMNLYIQVCFLPFSHFTIVS